MILPNSADFTAIPLPLLATPGDHRIQVAAFFKKRLYIGVTSHIGGTETTAAARILRYYPGAERWETVCEMTGEKAPVSAARHRRFPLELGWRAMRVISNATGSDALCITYLSLHHSYLLYSEDGLHFEKLPSPSKTSLPSAPFSQLHCFQNWLFAAPAGAMSDGIVEKSGSGAPLYVTRDPHANDWRLANSPGFDDPHNQVIHGLQTFNDWLYATVGNPFAGFQLWRTQALGDPPFAWEQVLDQGAQRYTLNKAVAAMAVFQNALYLGTGIPETELSPDEAAGGEIIRVFPDGRWELVMGKPRFSPIGLQVPASAYGPGFNENRNTLIAALASSGSALYAAVIYRKADESSGFQLWQTTDGETWQPLTSPVLDRPGAHSLRVMLTMPKFLLAAGTWHFDKTDTILEPCLWFGQTD